MSGHSYLSLCNCGFFAKRSYYNRYTINRNIKRLQMSRRTHVSRHSGAPMNNALHRIANGIINIELESTADTSSNNIRILTTYCKCKLGQKHLLRHGNYSYKDTLQEIDLRNQTIFRSGNYEEEYEYPEMNLGNLEMTMKNLEINSRNVTPEFDPKNYSEYDVNKSESNEKTEQDLQSNDKLNVAYYTNDYDYIIEPTLILDKNEEIAVPNKREKIAILENIIIKPATGKSNDNLLQASDTDLLNTSNDSSIPEEIETIPIAIVHETNVAKQSDDDEHISVRTDKMSKSNEEIVSKQTNNDAKVDKIEPIASISQETTAQNTPTKTKDSEKTKKAAKFNNFKVPKEVTHSKKIKVKKQQPRYVLTHVVEGYIIQESNFAFPIRTLQSQKTKLKTSITEESASTETKEDKVDQEENKTIEPASDTEVKSEIVNQEESATVEPVSQTELLTVVNEEGSDLKEECMTKKTVSPTEVKQTADLEENITKEPVTLKEVKDEEIEFNGEKITEEPVPPTEEKEEVPNGESNPFARLQQSTVRSWTVEDLSNHLQKFNWEETASLLEDNEIDGASLFMVTKGQLVIIGINEEQAEVICQFLQNGSSRGN